MIRSLIAVAVLVGSMPVSAEPKGADQQPTSLQKKASQRVICRDIEKIGSRLAKERVCMTAQQWDERRHTEQDGVRDAQAGASKPG